MNFTIHTASGSSHVHRIMKDGDLVILYMGHTSLDHIYLKEGEVHQNKFGAFHHNDIIGNPFGSKIHSRSSTGYIYVLEPSPELWSLALDTRTQIVNEIDSSVIVSMLDLYPGCRVIESGTGSGCMTISLARAVYPTGHIYTFEYNNIRAEKARDEFAKINLSEMITVAHRDICGKFRENEAGFNDIPMKSIDSVFFDLPEPWLALPYALRVLKPTRPICCYSPCIEQVMKTCEVLRSLGFYNINMIEVRQKLFDGRENEIENADLGLPVEEPSSTDGSPLTKRAKPSTDETTVIDKPEKTLYKPRSMPSTAMPVARVVPIMKGHSAFLTFALCPTSNMLGILAKKTKSKVDSVPSELLYTNPNPSTSESSMNEDER